MITFIFFAILVGITFSVYGLILSSEPVLNWWFRLGSRHERKWFWRIVWGCHICAAGQFAFWSYVLSWLNASYFDGKGGKSEDIAEAVSLYHFSEFGFFWLVAYVSVSIFSAFVFGAIIKHFKKIN